MTTYPLTDRAVITLTGPDTLALLERTVTHTVGDWPTGEMRYGALLTPQGKIIADYLALRSDEGVLLDTHAEAAPDLMKRLKLFRLRSKVDIELLEDWRVWAAVPAEGMGAVAATHCGPDPRFPGGQMLRCFSSPETISQLGLPDGAGDYDAARIAAGVPEWGRDYRAAEVFPTDVNMDQMHGIDYKKGCFVGQEVASRMWRKGKIRKRTLIVEGEALVPGMDIFSRTPVGTVTSVSGQKGLAMVRLDRLAIALGEGQALTCNDAPARIRLDTPPWVSAAMEAHRADTL